ncbi:MAG: isochorismatase family protein [Candidatus Latescibacteria bacterium]|nr:isochorismatase family protein [Candidatus Latescibacterota bacterium]
MPEYLEFPVRYCSMNAAEEQSFSHREKPIRLKADQTAFVLVDIWDVSRVPEDVPVVAGSRSFHLRADKITKEKIKPALEAAREAGLVVIHAPTDYVAIKYPQHRRLEQELNKPPSEPKPAPEWPPQGFAKARQREFDEDRYYEGFGEEDEGRRRLTYIPKIVEPLEDEYVISTGEQMNDILKRRGILNLVYVGFAANMCLIDKPGAMRQMGHKRGYRTILLRDCTTAVESHNTVKELLMTRVWIEWVEMVNMAYTATSETFIRACKVSGAVG